jgi:hypothetical protein
MRLLSAAASCESQQLEEACCGDSAACSEEAAPAVTCQGRSALATALRDCGARLAFRSGAALATQAVLGADCTAHGAEAAAAAEERRERGRAYVRAFCAAFESALRLPPRDEADCTSSPTTPTTPPQSMERTVAVAAMPEAIPFATLSLAELAQLSPHQLAAVSAQLHVLELFERREALAEARTLREQAAALHHAAAFSLHLTDALQCGALVAAAGLGARARLAELLRTCADPGRGGGTVLALLGLTKLRCWAGVLLTHSAALLLLPALLLAGMGRAPHRREARLLPAALLLAAGAVVGDNMVISLGGCAAAWRLCYGCLAVAHFGAHAAAEEVAAALRVRAPAERRIAWATLAVGLPAAAAWLPFTLGARH